MSRADVPVNMDIFRGIDGHPDIRKASLQLGGICFHDYIGAVVHRFIVMLCMLKIHQVDLVVGHAAGGYRGMSVKDQAGAGDDVFFDAAVKRLEIFIRPGGAHGGGRFVGRMIDRAAENILHRHALVDIFRIAVGVQKNAAVGEDKLTVAENVAEVIKPLRVPVDVFQKRREIIREVLKRNLRRNGNAAVRNDH